MHLCVRGFKSFLTLRYELPLSLSCGMSCDSVQGDKLKLLIAAVASEVVVSTPHSLVVDRFFGPKIDTIVAAKGKSV